MSRKGITSEEVDAVADGILATGENPTNRKVKEILGKGSDGTIHKYLSAWRVKRAQLTTPVVELPGVLLGALRDFEERVRAEERATYEARLVITMAEADDLATQLEATEEGLAAAELALSALRDENSALSAKNSSQETEIVQLKSDLDRAHNATELARTETAKSTNMLRVREEKIAELVQTNKRMQEELDAAQQALIASEKGLAVANAKLDAAIEKSQLLLQDKERLSGQLGAALDSATAARLEIAKVVGGREQQTMTMDRMPVSSERGERQPDVLEVAAQAVQQPQTTANDNIEG